MTIGQTMLSEFDEEMKNTRKVLERCPDEKWNWKPHEKSGTLGWLAAHVGTVPEWITMTINTDEFDYAPVGGPAFEPPKITNRRNSLLLLIKAPPKPVPHSPKSATPTWRKVGNCWPVARRFSPCRVLRAFAECASTISSIIARSSRFTSGSSVFPCQASMVPARM